MSPAFWKLVTSILGVLSYYCFASCEAAVASPSAPQSEAVCSYPGLVSEIPVGVSTSPSYFWVEQPENYWMAVAIRPQGGTDWDIGLFDSTAASPACVSGLLARSDAPGSAVDFVIGDYNWFDVFEDFPRNEYVAATRFSGSGSTVVEWDDADDGTLPNYPPYTGTLSANDILDVFDLHMYAGREHTIILNVIGFADIKLLIFENPGTGGYWAPRSARVFEMQPGFAATFTPAITGYHGVAVVNDNGLSGSYSVEVRSCSPPLAIPDGGGYGFDSTYTWYSFDQQSPAWSAVGVREQPGADWDLEVYANESGGTWPVCFDGLLARSQDVGHTDIVVGDFNHNPLGTYYARPYIFSGVGYASVSWDDGPDELVRNGPLLSRSSDGGVVLETWDVSLLAGVPYTFEFYGSGPAGLNQRILLFRNPGTGTFWGGRAAAEFDVPAGNLIAYTAPVTDRYGVVVVNDTSAAGDYQLGVRNCTMQGIGSGVSVPTGPVTGFYDFGQETNYWSAIGVRGVGTDDWDIAVYDNVSGNPWPNCLAGIKASSTGVGTVDFVVGDFNHNPQGFYYARSYRYSGGADARTEWDDGSDALTIDGSAVSRSTDANDVLETWDVLLNGGQTYYFQFNRGGTADTKLLLFKSNGATYWAPRSMRIVETTSTLTSFVAPATDWYGVVVVNDNGGSGTYTLRVSTSATDVASAGGATSVSELLTPAPNPTSGATQIRFRLAAPAQIAIDVVDVSGRVVAALPRKTWQAGPAETAWDGRDERGQRVAAGIYWIRASADGREIGRQKLVIVT